MEFSEQTWLLFARSLSGEANAAEIEALNRLLHKNPQLQQQYDILLRIWHSHKADEVISPQQETDKVEIEKIIHKAEEIEKGRIRSLSGLNKWKRALAVAASIVSVLALSWWLIYQKPNKPEIVQTPALVTENGKRIKSVLPDGSTVWLNAGSKIYYENDFKGATRAVKLVGEAFFDVVKMPGKPFIVHVNDININVLGTAFNVKAYENDKTVETSLFRGLVNITKTDDNFFQPILLYPNQKIVLPVNRKEANTTIQEEGYRSTERPSIQIKNIDSTLTPNQHIETAWMYDRLEFRGDDFVTLAHKLEYWYNIKIVFEDENVKALSFNGSFENETISQALIALKTANSFNYKINEHEILISSSK